MSMISDQCVELRGMADELAMVTNGIRSGVPASTWRGMTYVFEDAARSLRGAANTIWELRNKLADMVDQREEIERLKAEGEMPRYDGMDYEELVTAAQFLWMENAKLRGELESVGTAAYLYGRSDLKAVNAKLRELVRIMHSELVSCEDNGYVCGGHKFDGRVRELGVEADA